LPGWFYTYFVHILSGNGYQFWSGIGSDLGEVTLLGIVLVWWRSHNCHAPWLRLLLRQKKAPSWSPRWAFRAHPPEHRDGREAGVAVHDDPRGCGASSLFQAAR